MIKPDDRRTENVESVNRLVTQADQTLRGSDLLMDILREELNSTVSAHDGALDKASDIVGLYSQIRVQLSSEEKDAFFLALLETFQGMDAARKAQLRTIVRIHIQRIDKLHGRKR